MDLGAYAQIEDLSAIAAENDIHVDRLRGLRLMWNETPVSNKELEDIKRSLISQECEMLVQAYPKFSVNPWWYSYSIDTKKEYKKYFIYNEDKYVASIKWNNVHGKKRKAFKYVIKRAKKLAEEQFKMWNQFCGKDDVLYIHARLGTSNWSGNAWYKYKTKPWFICGIDDAFDSSYCDIYARIKPVDKNGDA